MEDKYDRLSRLVDLIDNYAVMHGADNWTMREVLDLMDASPSVYWANIARQYREALAAVALLADPLTPAERERDEHARETHETREADRPGGM